MLPVSIEKETFSASDKINLVSRMRLLRVVTFGRVKLNYQRTVRKNWNCEISGRRWTFLQRLGQTDMCDFCWGLHTVTIFFLVRLQTIANNKMKTIRAAGTLKKDVPIFPNIPLSDLFFKQKNVADSRSDIHKVPNMSVNLLSFESSTSNHSNPRCA